MANTTSKRLQLLGAFPAPTDAQVKTAVDENMAANPEKYVGPQGPQGEPGPAYELTEADKTSIANTVLGLLPTWEGGSY